MRIFVSHASADQPLVAAFEDLLNAITGLKRGIHSDVFVASTDHAIRKGDDWFEKLRKKLDAADVTYVLLTPESLNRPWVLYEFGRIAGAIAAKRSHRKRLIPVLFGVPRDGLPRFVDAIQLIDGNIQAELREGMTELATELGVNAKRDVATAVAKFLDRSQEIRADYSARTADMSACVNDAGITGLFHGTLRECPEALRRCKLATDRLVVVGPSLSFPLSDGSPRSLRQEISAAVGRNVDVVVFILNPMFAFSEREGRVGGVVGATRLLRDIARREGGDDNTCGALTNLTALRKEAGSKKKHLKVFVVDKETLDFVLMVDNKWLLCRSTIHWPRSARTQKALGGNVTHDYKPPIIECRPGLAARNNIGFFPDYSNFVDDLLVSAGLVEARTTRAGELARSTFPVTDVTSALKKVFRD